MIAKHFVLKKSLENNKYFLIYGKNRGLIEEILENKLRPNLPKNYYKYEEAEILRNLDNFQQDILNQSLFENEKLIIIKRVSDKVFSVIKNIISKNISNLYLILLSENLDKKSKIRKYFEKEKETICIPVYEDNLQTLSNIVFDFMREKKNKCLAANS